jgi:hypothetical protein
VAVKGPSLTSHSQNTGIRYNEEVLRTALCISFTLPYSDGTARTCTHSGSVFARQTTCPCVNRSMRTGWRPELSSTTASSTRRSASGACARLRQYLRRISESGMSWPPCETRRRRRVQCATQDRPAKRRPERCDIRHPLPDGLFPLRHGRKESFPARNSRDLQAKLCTRISPRARPELLRGPGGRHPFCIQLRDAAQLHRGRLNWHCPQTR